jgi:hypothetical protein
VDIMFKGDSIEATGGQLVASGLPATNGSPPARPICVMGMGRSGTSLTTALIGLLGVSLGPTERMLEPVQHDNARGYWEQSEIYEINKEILAMFGGSWESPPELSQGWERSPALAEIRDRASNLLADLFGACQGRWAWKDPRASVTLPFWRRLIGEMDFVLCIRNPAEVAASLARRGGDKSDFDSSISLWLHYVQAALQNTDESRRLILLYEDYFTDTEQQIRRLTDFTCGRDAVLGDGVREHVERFIDPGLWHQRDMGGGLSGVRAACPEVADLYASLLAQRTGEGGRPDGK